ncbi:MAG: alcohol dehydrogenase catalytic domain-containing protein [Planctomycetes bacterium]|nr:alcohol dehydrogenase catalytic domain-containing protein [Planctomycetota bacterium]
MPPSELTTRAVACAGSGRSRIEVRPLRRPGPGEVLLRMRVSGLCGTDLFKLASGSATRGAVLGHEVVGLVEEAGEGARGFAPGDRVVVPHHVACGQCALCRRGSETLCAVFRENLLEPGGYSERFLVRERAARLAARKVPGAVSDEAAVFLEPAACVLRGIERAGLPEPGALAGSGGPCAVVLGAGSMGLLHLLVLKATLPGVRVFVSDAIEERLRLAMRLGAEAALAPPEAEAAVREVTRGLGADAVFDTVGGAAVLSSALSLAREGGTVVLFAHAAPGERAAFGLNDLFKHERRVVGTYSGSLAEQARVHELIASGRLDASPLVTHRLPLSRFEEGVELCRARRALKVLYVPEGEA